MAFFDQIMGVADMTHTAVLSSSIAPHVVYRHPSIFDFYVD